MLERDFSTVYELTVPEDRVEQLTKSYISEFDEPPADFDLYEYMKKKHEDAWSRMNGKDPWYRILACEDADNAEHGEVYRLIGEGETGYDTEDFLSELREMRKSYDSGELDAGTKLYAASVKWGLTLEDGDPYEESELLWVCCHKGKWYIVGQYW